MSEKRLTFRPELQGLRAVAVLLVIIAHTRLAIVPGGFVGVDVFFVLSGYLITGILLSELIQDSRITFLSFYARRLKRLLPALIFMLSVIFILTVWLLSGVEARAQLGASPFTITWISNFYFLLSTFGYFDELANQDLFLHTWSLGVEEQFYVVWPAVLLLLFKLGKFRRVTNNNEFDIFLLGLGIIFFSSFIGSLYLTINTPKAAFYLMPSRVWQFSLGAAVFLFCKRSLKQQDEGSSRDNRKLGYVLLFLGLVLIAGSGIFMHPNLNYPGGWALIPSLGAAMVIMSGSLLPKEKYNLLNHPAMIWIGDRSYSLYLWHWPIFILGFSLGFQENILSIVCLLLLTLLSAILSFQFIELPFWKGRFSHAEPFRILLVSLLIIAIAVFMFFHTLRQLPKSESASDLSSQWRFDVPIIYKTSCDAWFHHSRVEPCILGTETANKTVVFLGDSIGAQWFSMIPGIFPTSDWRIITLTKSSCPIVDEDWFYQRLGKTYTVCAEWRNAVLSQLDTFKPDVLIVGSAATYDFSKPQWIEGSSRIFEQVSKIAERVLIIPGTPSLGFDGPGCVSRHLSSGVQMDRNACLANDRLQQVEPITKYLQLAVNRFHNVHMLNLNDLVCPDRNCRAVSEDGVVVFRDSQHLTDSFVRHQTPLIRERLMKLNLGLDLVPKE